MLRLKTPFMLSNSINKNQFVFFNSPVGAVNFNGRT